MIISCTMNIHGTVGNFKRLTLAEYFSMSKMTKESEVFCWKLKKKL